MVKSLSFFSIALRKGVNYVMLCILVTISIVNFAWSGVHGVIRPTNEPFSYYISFFSNEILDNYPGKEFTRNHEKNSTLSVDVYCSVPISTPAMLYYTASMSLPPSEINPGYRRLNDNFDIKVEVYIGEGVNNYASAPFERKPNNRIINQRCTPPKTTLSTKLLTGSKMRITYKVTKKIMNGTSFSYARLMELTGTFGRVEVVGSTHSLATIYLNGGTVSVPDKCVINEGTPITVEFGPVASTSTKLNGENYKKQISINVECRGGSFDTGIMDIKMSVQSAGSGIASFNRNYLGTTGQVNRSDLGIILRSKNNGLIAPNSFYPIDRVTQNRGRWELTAAPIAKPGMDIPEGEFDANATIIAEFP